MLSSKYPTVPILPIWPCFSQDILRMHWEVLDTPELLLSSTLFYLSMWVFPLFFQVSSQSFLCWRVLPGLFYIEHSFLHFHSPAVTLPSSYLQHLYCPRMAATKAGTVSIWFTTVTHYLRQWLGSIRHSIFIFYVNNVFTAKEEILTYVPGVMLNGLNIWYIILTRIPCYPEKWPVYKWQRLHYWSSYQTVKLWEIYLNI